MYHYGNHPSCLQLEIFFKTPKIINSSQNSIAVRKLENSWELPPVFEKLFIQAQGKYILQYGVLPNHGLPICHRPLKVDHQPTDPPTGLQPTHRLPTTDHQPTDHIRTGPVTIDPQPTDRFPIDPPTTDNQPTGHRPTDHRLNKTHEIS